MRCSLAADNDTAFGEPSYSALRQASLTCNILPCYTDTKAVFRRSAIEAVLGLTYSPH